MVVDGPDLSEHVEQILLMIEARILYIVTLLSPAAGWLRFYFFYSTWQC